MNITTRGKYGLKIITDLAMAYGVGRVNLKSIAKRQGLSEHYIEQLIAPLKKAGFVISIRGVHGGYSLARPPDGITVGAVLRTLEGSLAPVDCLRENDATCGSADCGSCITKSVWNKIYESLNDVVDSITIEDLVKSAAGEASFPGDI